MGSALYKTLHRREVAETFASQKTAWEESPMTDRPDNANAVVRPPIAWALAIAAGLAIHWFVPWHFVPGPVPGIVTGALVFAAGFALAIWAITTFTRAGTQVPTNMPTSRIVAHGPYRFTRNPIYLGFFLGLIGLAVGFDSAWLLVALVGFFLVIRYGVVAREEVYLERKFGDDYRTYTGRVRRWL
jgi:protein-S-isoprenylcysteine O-methyltransferase Ste14